MKTPLRESLAERFHKTANASIDMASNPRWMACAFALGAMTMPFSSSAGLMVMAMPTIYTGLGYGYRLTANALSDRKPEDPQP